MNSKQHKQKKVEENHFLPKQLQSAKSLIPPNKGINFAIQQKQAPAKNTTGLPDNLKSGIEHLSGIDVSDVKVHYNSAQPAQLNAHAYAQGNQIHVAPGQEKHLPHEAWHVVQQKQGRVKPTKQLKGKVNINDDAGLEKEADVMGKRAKQLKVATDFSEAERSHYNTHIIQYQSEYPTQLTIQLMSDIEYDGLSHAWGKATVDRALHIIGKNVDIATRDEVFEKLKEITLPETHAAIRTKVDEMQHGPQDGDEFMEWLQNGTKPSVMNCWEYVFYMAVQWNHLTREQILQAYDVHDYVPSNRAINAFKDGLTPINFDRLSDLSIGDAIILGNVERHVVISLGGAFVADLGTWNIVQIRPLRDVVNSQSNNVNMAYSHFKSEGSAVIDELGGADVEKAGDFWGNRFITWEHGGMPASIPLLRQKIDQNMQQCGVSAGGRQKMLQKFDECANPTFYYIPAATWAQNLQRD